MLQVCRTCLQEITDLNFISLSDATCLTESLKVRDVLSVCVPELALDIIADPVMCGTCMTSLHIAYDFKRKCLHTEERIRSYVQSIVIGSKDDDDDDDNDEEENATKSEWVELEQLEMRIKDEPENAVVEEEVKTEEAVVKRFIYSKLTNSWSEENTDMNPSSKPHNHNDDESSDNAELGECRQLRALLQGSRATYECDVCQQVFERQSSLHAHKKMHGGKPFKCTACDYGTTQRVGLIKHMRGHTGEKPYTCDVCEYRTAHHSSIKHHMALHTGRKAYPCKRCDFSSSFKSSLLAHVKVHERRRTEHAEKQCTFATSTKRNMEQIHVAATTTSTTCQICRYTLPTSPDLQRHMQSHIEAIPYSCASCGFTSADDSDIKNHQQVHHQSTGGKPFKCTECRYAAATRDLVVKHLRTHTGERPYKCTQCDFTASHSFSLKRHMTVHSDEKPFSCPMCDYTAKRRTYLLDHIRTHTGEKPYKCDRCSYSASRRPTLVAHMRRHDPNYKRENQNEGHEELDLIVDTSESGNESTVDGEELRGSMEDHQTLLKETVSLEGATVVLE